MIYIYVCDIIYYLYLCVRVCWTMEEKENVGLSAS